MSELEVIKFGPVTIRGIRSRSDMDEAKTHRQLREALGGNKSAVFYGAAWVHDLVYFAGTEQRDAEAAELLVEERTLAGEYAVTNIEDWQSLGDAEDTTGFWEDIYKVRREQ